MNFQNWRRFAFFDKEPLKDPDNEEQPFLGLQDLSFEWSASGQGQILFGESSGSIYMINKQWNLNFFKAHSHQLYSFCYIKQHNICVTVGNDELGLNPQLKVWLLDKLDKQGVPFCSRITKTSPNNRPVKPVSLAVHSSLQFMAVGFEDSSVLLYKGDVARERFSSRAQVLRDGLVCATEGSITGLAFNGSIRHLTLFVVTQHQVLAYTIGAKEQESKIELDQHGCAFRCWALGDTELDSQLIIARNDAVYCYQPPDLRSQCFAFEGEKIMIKTAGCYLLTVCRDVGSASINESNKMNMVTIYDIPSSFIAYSAPVPEVMEVVHEWGSFFVISKNGRVYQLKEKDTKSKLDILFRKNLYDVAISVAKRHNCDEDKLADIFKQYGDYLYQKNDFANAINQYIHTIGKLEASYVIRKFLDAQRVPQLTSYLEALHRSGLANEDHTTILLNCYTKQTDTKKLQQFVASAKEVYFDVDTAIKVLRVANYTDDALYLARLYHRHDSVIQIFLENKKLYSDAIKYIANLAFEQAEEAMKQHGKVLLSQVPDETTSLLKQLCTGFQSPDSEEPHVAQSDQFIHIFVNDPKRLQEFLEHMLKVANSCPSIMYNTLLELYLRDYSCSTSDAEKAILEDKIMQFLEDPQGKYELDHALILCQTNSFSRGMLYIYEKANLLQQILQHHMARKDYTKIIEMCKKHAGAESHSRELWLQALWFFARNEECPVEYVSQLLHHIDQLGVVPPLMVLEILSHSSTVTLAVVKQYLLRWLRNENDQIQKDESLIEHYKEEIAKTESLIENLKTSGQVFQVAKCSACDHALEIPTVHFLCRHSYHQHCFESYAENENECPACLPENKKLISLHMAQHQSKDPYQQFRSELQEADDSISTLANYFGKGLFHRQVRSGKDVARTDASLSISSISSLKSDSINIKEKYARENSANPFETSTNPFDEED